MENKNYAALLRVIFGEKSMLVDDEAMNANPKLAEAVEDKMFELLEVLSPLQYISINDFLLEGKSREDFAQYIRDNADDIATQIQAKALRTMRHPKHSKAFREFMVYKDEKDMK
ncbi:MAG: hypothetical protein E7539_07195 [Ruminococcaceae bacterium]|nr:hypothetical protein [Oscillospiraceae bacterium]